MVSVLHDVWPCADIMRFHARCVHVLCSSHVCVLLSCCASTVEVSSLHRSFIFNYCAGLRVIAALSGIMDTTSGIVDVIVQRLIGSCAHRSRDHDMTLSLGLYNQAAAVLVWLLSKSPGLASSYVLSVSARQRFSNSGSSDDVSIVLRLLSWWQDHNVAVLIDGAASDLNHKVRVRADDFLMRSLVAEYVSLQNVKGLSVPTDMVIQTYLRLWLYRPCPERLQGRLVQLTHHYNTRRRFAAKFRAEWMLQHSTIQVARDLDQAEIANRVVVVI